LVIIFLIGVVILFFILIIIIVLRIFIVVLFRFALRYFIRFGLFRLFLHFLIFSAGSELASGFLLYGRRHISVIVILVIKRNVIFIIEVIQFLIPVNQFDRKHDHKDKKQEKHTARCNENDDSIVAHDPSDPVKQRCLCRLIFLLGRCLNTLICPIIRIIPIKSLLD